MGQPSFKKSICGAALTLSAFLVAARCEPDPPAEGSESIACDATYEPNNLLSEACSLELGPGQSVQVAGQLTVTTDPDDYYALDEVLAGRTYTLELEAAGACSTNGLGSEVSLVAPGEPEPVELLGVQRQTLAKVVREFVPNTDGRAIIHIDGSCAYELTALRSTEDGLEHSATLEPNNSPSTAARLELAPTQSTELVVGQLAINTDADDYYSLEGVLAGHTYTLEVTVTGACPTNGVASELNVLTAEGPAALLARELQSSGKLSREFTPSVDGRAIIRISGQCAYEVVVHRSTDDGLEHAETFEPNNSPSTAARLELGQVASAQLSLGTDVSDYYAVEVEDGGAYSVELAATGACPVNGLSTEVSLVGLEGSSALLARSLQSTGRVSREFMPSVGGRAIVRIGGQCAYDLVLNRGSGPPL